MASAVLDRFRRNTSKKTTGTDLQEEETEEVPGRVKRKESGGNWRLSDDEQEDEVRQVRSSNPGIASAEKMALQGCSTSPQSGASISSPKELSDILIPAGASLLDGLRLLLVHHLRAACAGTENINLTAGQAELLEHHLSRLSSYAQKIVHTLAFATRFLSSAHDQDQNGGASSEREAEASTSSGRRDVLGEPQDMTEPKRSTLRLKDRELLEIYRGAQLEACREADWRGLATPRTTARSEGSVYSDSSTSKSGAITPGDAQLLRVISEAMRQPGRTPETVAAEIVQRSDGSCAGCQSQKAHAARVSATVRWPRSPPDPGQRHGHHD